jgi:aminodeoxyfutalosine synthase
MSLKQIEKKVFSDKRLTPGDALVMFQSNDIFTIGRLASYVAAKKNNDNVYFVRNRHINPTNICVNRCRFCAFSRSKGDKGAYELSIKQIIKKLGRQKKEVRSQKNDLRSNPRILESLNPAYSEVHIVGGLHPDWPFDYYLQMLKTIKSSYPHIHIKAFTAVEIDHLSKISGLNISDTLEELKHAGLDSMPGGGAEIFNAHIRNRICPEKINGKKWLTIIKKAHRSGIRSNATMLYGHYENYRHRTEHLVKLRDLQDITGGFQAFIPLAFHPMNTEMNNSPFNKGGMGRFTSGYTSGIDDIKTIAVSRLFLDNFTHIKAYWIMLGEKIAQLALKFGADDLDGTIIEEKITRSASALSEKTLTKEKLIHLIKMAGKVPVERDSFYQPVKGSL